jgi:hypothetical protein
VVAGGKAIQQKVALEKRVKDTAFVNMVFARSVVSGLDRVRQGAGEGASC